MSQAASARELATHYELVVIARTDNLITTYIIFMLAFFNILGYLPQLGIVRYSFPIINYLLCHLNLFYCYLTSLLIAKARLCYGCTCYPTLNLLRSVFLSCMFIGMWCFLQGAIGMKLWATLTGNALAVALLLCAGFVASTIIKV